MGWISSIPYFKVQYEVCIWSTKMRKDQNVESLYAFVVEEESRNAKGRFHVHIVGQP